MQHLYCSFKLYFVFVTRRPLPFQAQDRVAKPINKLRTDSQNPDRINITSKTNSYPAQQPKINRANSCPLLQEEEEEENNFLCPRSDSQSRQQLQQLNKEDIHKRILCKLLFTFATFFVFSSLFLFKNVSSFLKYQKIIFILLRYPASNYQTKNT